MDAETIMKIAESIKLVEKLIELEVNMCEYCSRECLNMRTITYENPGSSFPLTEDIYFCSDFQRQ